MDFKHRVDTGQASTVKLFAITQRPDNLVRLNRICYSLVSF